MAVQQTGDFSYTTFEGVSPRLAPVQDIAAGIGRLDARHEQALDEVKNIEAVKLADINAADEPYRRELLQNAKSSIEAHVKDGNYAFALNEAKRQARLVSTDEGLANRVKSNNEYQAWRQQLLNRNDISSEKKEWLLSKNKYLYGELVTPEGDTVRKTWDQVKREIGRAEAREIPASEILSSAMKLLKPEQFGGESILYKRANGSWTTNIDEADPENSLPYLKTGNSTTRLTASKIKKAAVEYLNANPEALASMRQEYDFLIDTNQADLLGKDGLLMDFNSFIDRNFDGLSESYSYSAVNSTQQPLDGLKYAAERRMRKFQQQEQVQQVPISSRPINVVERADKKYNDQLEASGNLKKDIFSKLNNLGFGDIDEDNFTSSSLKSILASINPTALGITKPALDQEKANIQRLANDYFLIEAELNVARQATEPVLTRQESEAKDILDSMVSGNIPSGTNVTYNNLKTVVDTFVQNKREIIVSNKFGRASLRNKLDDNNIDYTETNGEFIISPTVENLFAYINSGIDDSGIFRRTTGGESLTGNADQDPINVFKRSIIDPNTKANKKVATKFNDISENYNQNYPSLELTSILRNSDQVNQLRDFTVNTLRNPDSRNAIRIYASSDKEPLSFTGDGLTQKEKNELFDNLIINDNDAVIGLVPNAARGGQDLLEVTIAGTAETRNSDGTPNRSFYIDLGSSDQLFNTALQEVYNSNAYQISSQLSRLDKIAHNRSIDLPSVTTGFEDSRFRYTNNNGTRQLTDTYNIVSFTGTEIDKVISGGRRVDNILGDLKSRGYDYDTTQGKQAIEQILNNDPDFINLVYLYALAANNDTSPAILQQTGNYILDSIYQKYR